MQSGVWHIRFDDDEVLNLNSPQAVDYIGGLLERVEELEAQLRKRSRKKAANGTETE